MRFMDLFRPKWKNSNELVREQAVEELTDQAALADVARNDESERVRSSALEKLTDKAVVADIAKNHEDGSVRKSAVEILTDKAVLADIQAIRNRAIMEQSNEDESGMTHRGGIGEPYCSETCYDKGGKHGGAIRLNQESGVCSICQTPVRMSLSSAGAAFPYGGQTLYICGSASCREKVRAFVDTKNVCCMCGKTL